MPQKKKKSNKKSNIKKHIKHKHINQNNQNIVFQSIPNYSSDQNTGHQYNKNKVQFAPAVQQESRTDNLVGDSISKVMNKIDNNENQQTQQYTKEIQPQNNNSNSGNNSIVNIYNDGGKYKTDISGSNTGTAISDGIKSGIGTAIGTGSTIGATETAHGLNGLEIAGITGISLLGLGGIGGIGRAIYKNRGGVNQGIRNISTNARNRLGFGGQRSGYNTVQHEPPIGTAFEHVPISENPAIGTNL